MPRTEWQRPMTSVYDIADIQLKGEEFLHSLLQSSVIECAHYNSGHTVKEFCPLIGCIRNARP